MKIKQAKNELDWIYASELLCRVVGYLNNIEKPLWTENQVSIVGLQSSYKREDLHFLLVNSRRVGVVFLQETDPFFWPELAERDSLYLHKLAIEPSLLGKGHGLQAMQAILLEARNRALNWIRLDCDDRPELHSFYLSCGFELVDIKQIQAFQVARYQLFIN